MFQYFHLWYCDPERSETSCMLRRCWQTEIGETEIGVSQTEIDFYNRDSQTEIEFYKQRSDRLLQTEIGVSTEIGIKQRSIITSRKHFTNIDRC